MNFKDVLCKVSVRSYMIASKSDGNRLQMFDADFLRETRVVLVS